MVTDFFDGFLLVFFIDFAQSRNWQAPSLDSAGRTKPPTSIAQAHVAGKFFHKPENCSQSNGTVCNAVGGNSSYPFI